MTRCFLSSLLFVLALVTFPGCAQVDGPERSLGITEFGHLFSSLSEPDGFFDTDNFISNEAGYLKVLPTLKRLGIQGGAYIGVGPDQNYSYIAEIQPRIVFIIDIRRQNALQHLYFKSLFELSANRLEYLERLFGRPMIPAPKDPEDLNISELLRRIDESALDKHLAGAQWTQALEILESWELPLSRADWDALRYIARAFTTAGPGLRFQSFSRPPRLIDSCLCQQRETAPRQDSRLLHDHHHAVSEGLSRQGDEWRDPKLL